MIKILWTAQGQILGDVKTLRDVPEGTLSGYIVENPVFLAPGPQGVSMMPVLMFSDDKEVTLTAEEVKFGGKLFEPITELRNHYTSQFGSGIQLLTN